MRGKIVKRFLLPTAILVALPIVARADDTTLTAPHPDDGTLTLYGITLYGTIDLGVAYQTHGAPLSSDFPPGTESLISKNSNEHYFGVSPNGLSQSKIGLKGSEDLGDAAPGWKAIFKLETGFQPTSGNLPDGLGSLAHNNGGALNQQTSAGDSSRDGQPFNSEAYVGVSSPQFGTLTFGRQNSLELDNILIYDPQGASNAFSVIGYSGAAAGFGSTEDARLDSAMKYVLKVDAAHFEALYQFSGTSGTGGSAYEFDVGGDWAGLSVDALYNAKKDEISASSLTAEQFLVEPANSLSATVFDSTAYSLLAKYSIEQLQLYAGSERILFDNPSNPLQPGYSDLGGYTLSVINDKAYTNNKMLDIYWLGAKYAITPDLDLRGAWYHYYQHSFKGNGCTNNTNSACSGTLDAFSLVADYRLTKRFDLYGGVMDSQVARGLAQGYLNTSTFAPQVGARFQF